MESKNRTRWGLIIVSLFFIGLAVDYFFLHILFEQKLKEQQHQQLQLHREHDEHQEETISPKKPSTRSSPPENIQLEFQQKAEKCLGPELGKSSTPDALIQNLEATDPVQSTHFELENTHIRLPDGSIRRLHLIPAESANTRNARELRYFSLDEEGLPLRIELPPEKSLNPKPEFLESLKKQGTTTYHETRETKTLKDGTILSLTLVNDKVYEFRIFQNGKSFSCRELNCLCR